MNVRRAPVTIVSVHLKFFCQKLQMAKMRKNRQRWKLERSNSGIWDRIPSQIWMF